MDTLILAVTLIALNVSASVLAFVTTLVGPLTRTPLQQIAAQPKAIPASATARKDSYTPAETEAVPLDQSVPNFAKPLRTIVREEHKEAAPKNERMKVVDKPKEQPVTTETLASATIAASPYPTKRHKQIRTYLNRRLSEQAAHLNSDSPVAEREPPQ